MNVGLLTFYRLRRYGAVLQAYALTRAVESLGGRCELLDYADGRGGEPTENRGGPHRAALSARAARFAAFEETVLHRTSRRYESLDDLRAAPAYDALLLGGGPVWNPKLSPVEGFDPAFFGAFSDARKIAYAASFGIPHIAERLEGELRGYLADIGPIGVRERQSGRIIKELTGRDVPTVLDPTLLLEREAWSAVAAPPLFPPESYILCYCDKASGALTPYIRALAEQTGLPVVRLCGTAEKVHPQVRRVMDAGPAEFLSLFRHAACICTDSFRGAVFSIQFQRPFFVGVTSAELSAPAFSRTLALLAPLGLTDRVVGRGDTAALGDPVDWAAVECRLVPVRAESLEFLAAALLDREPAPAPAPPPASDLPRLAGRESCTGCTACAETCPRGAIAMVRDAEGFSYPAVDGALCAHCGQCTQVCPALRPRESGPLPAAYAAWNRDDTVRKDSASGGVFSLLAEFILESGGVVFGAGLGAHGRVRHEACFKKEQLRRLRGVKYVQSDLGDTFSTVKKLLESRPVLFTGTPCQVDGLYRYLDCRPENLITCDLVCQGVPSPGVWEDWVRALEIRKGKDLRTVRFRNKVTSWQDSHFTLLYEDGSVDSEPLARTEYGRALARSLLLRPVCYRCPYTSMSRVGDLTLGDFRGLRPDEISDQQERGVSLLLVNTPHGSHLFDQLPLAKKVFAPERAIVENPPLAAPPPRPGERAEFFAAYRLQDFESVRRQFFKQPPLPYRAAAKLLPPKLKARLKKEK